MTETKCYSLEELGRLTNLSPRTIRSYIQKGLLPGAATRGRNASYTDIHLDRLRCMQLIREKSGLPLDELRMVMLALSEEQIHRIATGQEEVLALPVGQQAPVGQGYGSPVLNRSMEPGTGLAVSGPSDIQTREKSRALDYLHRMRKTTGSSESRFAELVRTMEELTRNRRVYRKARNEWWATVKVTEDMEIRVRGLSDEDIGRLERLADILRSLLMKGG